MNSVVIVIIMLMFKHSFFVTSLFMCNKMPLSESCKVLSEVGKESTLHFNQHTSKSE